jgi:hypothetical protein
MLDFEILPKIERWKDEVPKVSPHFQNSLQYMDEFMSS